MKKIEFFKVEGDRINRIRKHCPKCGPAVFLAEHNDRFSCGKCGYTEFKGGIRPPKPTKVEEKPAEQPAEAASEILKKETPIDEHPKREAPISEVATHEVKPSEPSPVETHIEEKSLDKTPKEEESSESKQKKEKSPDESSEEDKKY